MTITSHLLGPPRNPYIHTGARPEPMPRKYMQEKWIFLTNLLPLVYFLECNRRSLLKIAFHF